MRAARLHGVGDLRVERPRVPRPGRGELLVRVEACGICPTDVRKHAIGTRDGYPLNPGHEWVGAVTEVGSGVTGWSTGARVYGDTYAGYAEYALLPVEPGGRGRTARSRFPPTSMPAPPRSWSRSQTAFTRCVTRRGRARGRACAWSAAVRWGCRSLRSRPTRARG